jgi:hypothetical protein
MLRDAQSAKKNADLATNLRTAMEMELEIRFRCGADFAYRHNLASISVSYEVTGIKPAAKEEASSIPTNLPETKSKSFLISASIRSASGLFI